MTSPMRSMSINLAAGPLWSLADELEEDADLFARLGRDGAAILARIVRELAVNARTHGSAVGTGQLDIFGEASIVVRVKLPGKLFDSVSMSAKSDTGALSVCARMLVARAANWTWTNENDLNCIEIRF